MTTNEGNARGALGSPDDVRLELLAEGLARAATSLAISLKMHARNPGHPVYRSSVDDQYDMGLGQVEETLGLGNVVFSDDSAAVAASAISTFLDLRSNLTWRDTDAGVARVFQARVDAVYVRGRILKEGRPCRTFEALLARHARIPEIEPPPAPAGEPGEQSTDPVGRLPADAAPDAPIVLHETIFSYGDGAGSHQALIGRMFLGYLVHARALPEAEALKRVSPAALSSFAQSIERGLAGYQGPAAFRVVRTGGDVKVHLHRLGTPPAAPGPKAG